MKSLIKGVIAAAFVGLAAPAFAGMVQAEPGVTLTEAAQAKFNADTGRDGRQAIMPTAGSAVPTRQLYASAGLSETEGRAMPLEQVFVAKINRENGRDGEQLADSSDTVASRAYGQGGDYRQLIASAHLSPAQADGMSLTEIAAAKFASENDD